MCCLRQVRNVYTQCGHGVTLPDEMITCENSNCRWSPFHPLTCKPPSCLRKTRRSLSSTIRTSMHCAPRVLLVSGSSSHEHAFFEPVRYLTLHFF
ncbi:hypothetical protein BDZ89DRAFT_1063086 [Hymenopellis radicata]|nr:hypothetical protein BDZ89DRAFT_1063086 [Hymenopellis radicata]